MTKKWFHYLIAMLLVLSVTFTSFTVFADTETTAPGDENTTETETETETENPEESEEESFTGEPVKDNKGASQSLEGYVLVSPEDDDPENLDLYFNKEEIAFKIAQKDKDGNVKYVWSSQLSPKDLGLDPAMKLEDRTSKVHPRDRDSMSLLIFDYVDLGNTITTKEMKGSTYTLEHKLVGDKYDLTGKGVSLQIEFPTLNIKIPLIVEVDGQKLNVRIPKDQIYENINGAENIREAIENMDKRIDQISDMIAKAKRQVKKENDKKAIESRFQEISEQILKIKEAAATGIFKGAEPDQLKKRADTLYRIMEREGFFTQYPQIEESVKQIAELVVESLGYYDIIVGEVANGIYSIMVMPFLGSGTLQEEGYVFYPDGAGAISYFNVNHPSELGYYSQPVYSQHVMDTKYLMFGERTSNPALYPVFGVNKGDYGFVGIIDEGDVDANIEYWPGNKSYTLGRIYSSLLMRRKIRYNRGTNFTEVYDTSRFDYDRNIQYIFLKEGKADYSGMANAYRDYLKENQLLNKAIKEGEEMPLALDFLMGVKEQGVLGQKTIKMTAYEEVKETLEKLRNDGVTGLVYTNLYEWTKKQGEPNKYDADGALGGARKLKELAAYAVDHNVVLGLYFDPAWAERENATSNQVNNYFIRDSLGLTIEYKDDSDGYRFSLFSPKYIQEQHLGKILSKLKSFGVNSGQMDMVGSLLYYDYSKVYNYVSRGSTADIFTDLAKMVNDELGNSSVSNGNMYMWKYATRIESTTISDMEYLYGDQSVPFLEMVLHGNIGYTGSSPYNTMHNDVQQTLQYIEFGCMPYFFLTKEEVSKMQFSNASWRYDYLYSADLAAWYDRVVQVYKEFNDTVGYLWSAEIVHHTELKEGLKRVEYSEGSVIYINYNEVPETFTDPISGQSITVGAQTYEVRRGA